MDNDDRPCGHAQARGRESIPSWPRFRRWHRYQAHSSSTIRPKMKIAVLQLAKGCQVCGCAQAQRRWPLVLEYRHRCTGYTAGTERTLKSAAAGGIVKFGWVPIVPFLGSGRAPGEVIIPVFDQGFRPSTWPSCPPCAGGKRKRHR
jgi:hypothetical protein